MTLTAQFKQEAAKHPSAPDEPPGDKVLGRVTGLLDRMRDAVSKRGTQS